jgi:hypothetical protein
MDIKQWNIKIAFLDLDYHLPVIISFTVCYILTSKIICDLMNMIYNS